MLSNLSHHKVQTGVLAIKPSTLDDLHKSSCFPETAGIRALKYQASSHLGGFERIICWKMNCQEENSPLIWTVNLKNKDKNVPVDFIGIIYWNQPQYVNAFKRSEINAHLGTFTYWSHDCGLPVKHWREQEGKVRNKDMTKNLNAILSGLLLHSYATMLLCSYSRVGNLFPALLL